jgi:hypothetical protein
MNATSKMFKEKKKVNVKSDFHLLLEVMNVFEVLEFITT